MELTRAFEIQKREWQKKSQYRQLSSGQGIDFCSNDYLGFSHHPRIKENLLQKINAHPLGSTGSRLLRGHNDHLEKFENQLAEFSSMESALFFPSGYQANVGLLSSLLKRRAQVFSDSHIHASIIDGIKLSGCEKFIFPHNDLKVLESLLFENVSSALLNVVVVESLYSMRGDFAPLKEISALCEKYRVHLIVDEAHATGLYGKNGSGLVDELNLNDKVLAKVHTAGKSLGTSGAWVAMPSMVKEILVNSSRSFIYSTAPASYQWLAVSCALDQLTLEYQALRKVFEKRVIDFQSFLQSLSQKYDFKMDGFGGPVTALICGDNSRSLELMNSLKQKGFDVRAIRPPTVPKGKAQLRITLPLNRTEQEIDDFKEALSISLQEVW